MSEAPLALGRRVIVTGLVGSGKSTVSLALAAKTGLPVKDPEAFVAQLKPNP